MTPSSTRAYTTAVVAGMGGSSLAPDVLHRTFGIDEGYLALRILDSTDPAYVAATLDDLDPLRTLVHRRLASPARRRSPTRSWRTRGRAPRRRSRRSRTTATSTPAPTSPLITDPGKSVEAIAHHDDFREVFLNPPDIGGRYSALTYVGLVPASLIGIDLDAAARVGRDDAGRLPRAGPGRQPGRLARPGHRDARRGPAATS